MKNLKLYFLMILAAAFFTACGDDSAGTEGGGGNTSGETSGSGGNTSDTDKPTANAKTAVSVWEGHSVKTESKGGGKWLASVTFGEEMTLLGETEVDEKNDRPYEKVRLLDGKEGWIRGDLIEKGGKLAAVTSESQIYKRPSISNIGDAMVKPGTIVVIKQEKEEFSEFIAKNDAGNKRQRGWLLGKKTITSNETDIAAAIMLSKALAEKNPAKRKQKLEQITGNASFEASVFLAEAQAALDATEEASELAEDQLMITGDKVNVRSGPTIEEDNKVFQVNSGDICKIVQKGDMDEIGGKLDYWYKISINGQEGWIFGTFSSKAM